VGGPPQEREQAQARFGVALLATGFVLQLPGLVAAIALSVAILVDGFVAGRVAARLKAPLNYHEYPRQPDGIIDERFGFNLASVDDVQTWRRFYAERVVGAKPKPQTTPIRATINDGRWLAECPNCPGSAMLVTPGIDTVVCDSVCNGEYPVVFPEDREAIEQLLQQPREKRNWSGETLDELCAKRCHCSRRRSR
jgi:hypothetical protein